MKRSANAVVGALALLALSACSTPHGQLFNGRDFAGWEMVAPAKSAIENSFDILPDAVIASKGQPVGYIATTGSYRNYRLHAEWRWSGQPGNGGVLLHIGPGSTDPVWPRSLQVQTKHKNVGDVLPMAGASFAEPLTSAPGAKVPIKAHIAPDSERPAGQWNTCDIVSRDGSIEVTVNGVLQNRVTQAAPSSGRIGFQLEGAPYELRKVTLTRLD